MTNSAESIPVLNTLNGVAVSTSAVGRALGPWVGGLLMSFGVESGWGIAPWWFLAAAGIANHVSTWWLVEGEGIKSESETALSEEDEEEVEELLLASERKEDESSLATTAAAATHPHAHPTVTTLKRGHKRNKSSVTVASHGEDPELALELQDFSPTTTSTSGFPSTSTSSHNEQQQQQQNQIINVGVTESITAGVSVNEHGLGLGGGPGLGLKRHESEIGHAHGAENKENERRVDVGGEKEAVASGSTLVAPAFKTRLRSPVGRRESLG